MEQPQTLEQMQAELQALRAQLARHTEARNALVSITKDGTKIMVKRASKGWPILGTPEDFEVVLAQSEAIKKAALQITRHRV